MSSAMQVALEQELRDDIQLLAARADISMKNWILDNILSVHRKFGITDYLSQAYGSPIVLAPPTNAQRFNIRIDDPAIDTALEETALVLQRTKPQIVYTLITHLVDEKLSESDISKPEPRRSLLA